MAKVSELPIDIHYNKLLDWLIDRRHCDLKWASVVRDIREKVTTATTNLPDSPEFKILKEVPDLSYFHVLKIVENLKQSEADGAKNIFGQYSSQRIKSRVTDCNVRSGQPTESPVCDIKVFYFDLRALDEDTGVFSFSSAPLGQTALSGKKLDVLFCGLHNCSLQDWLEVKKLYEKRNVYLAEAAQILMRNVNFEIPALKRQIAKSQQIQQECDKKESDYEKNAKLLKEKYLEECQKLGIKGEDPKQELLQLAQELPDTLSKIANEVRNLKPVVEYYQAFVKFNGSAENVPSLSILTYVIQNGNTSVYEWKTGQKPQVSTLELPLVQSNLTSEVDLEIDWGDISEADDKQIEQIELGADLEIDISGITVEDTGISEPTVVKDDNNTITVEAEGKTTIDEVDPSELLTLLEATSTKDSFLDDMCELQSFLAQRKQEKGRQEDIVQMNQLEDSPKELTMETEHTLAEMKSSVDSIINGLTSAKNMKLFLIRSSPTYVDRVVDSIQLHLRQANKSTSAALKCSARRDEALRTQRTAEPCLSKTKAHTKELQRQVAIEISKLYSDRVVNIMGEINQI